MVFRATRMWSKLKWNVSQFTKEQKHRKKYNEVDTLYHSLHECCVCWCKEKVFMVLFYCKQKRRVWHQTLKTIYQSLMVVKWYFFAIKKNLWNQLTYRSSEHNYYYTIQFMIVQITCNNKLSMMPSLQQNQRYIWIKYTLHWIHLKSLMARKLTWFITHF